MDVTPEALRDLYVGQKLTTREIAQRTGVSPSTVARRLRQFGIAARAIGPKTHPRLRSKWWLERQYLTLEKSTVVIAAEIGASPRVVYHWLLEHGIPTRARGGSLKGKEMPLKGRRRISAMKRGRYTGADNWNWKGGYVDPTFADRRSYRAKRWRNSVKERDGKKCVHCGSSEGRMHAHHIKPWKKFPDLRFDVANGITLCVPCHEEVHRFSFDFCIHDKSATSADQALPGA